MREGWTYKKLGEICKVITKGTTPTTIGYKFTDNGINFIKIECIDSIRNLIKENLTFISEECNNSMIRSQLQEKDLLFSIAGALGRIYIVEKSVLPANTNQALAIIRLSDKQDLFLLFLSYFLNSNTIKRQIEKDKVGVAQFNLSLGQIKDFIIPIPSIAEQQHIVSELDLLSSIIEKKKAQLKEYDQLAQSIFYDMFGDPVTNEKGWEVKKLGEVCETTSGGTPSKSHPEYYEGGIIPWLRSGEVSQGFIYNTEFCITEEGLRCSSAKMIPVDSVAIAMYGATVGQVGIIKSPMCTNQAICSILPNDIFIPIFLYHFLLSKKSDFLKVAVGGAQPNISQTVIKQTDIGIPPLSLQQSFASKIESIERQKALIQQSITEAETLFNSRMDYYFN